MKETARLIIELRGKFDIGNLNVDFPVAEFGAIMDKAGLTILDNGLEWYDLLNAVEYTATPRSKDEFYITTRPQIMQPIIKFVKNVMLCLKRQEKYNCLEADYLAICTADDLLISKAQKIKDDYAGSRLYGAWRRAGLNVARCIELLKSGAIK